MTANSSNKHIHEEQAQKSVSLPADILAVIEETREGAMEELQILGNYNNTGEKSEEEKTALIMILEYLNKDKELSNDFKKSKAQLYAKIFNSLDPKEVDSAGRNVFMIACMEEDFIMEEVMKKSFPELIDLKDNYGDTTLMLCARKKLGVICCDLIKSGADLDIRNKASERAIDIARKQKMKELVEYIIKERITEDFIQEVQWLPVNGMRMSENIRIGKNIEDTLNTLLLEVVPTQCNSLLERILIIGADPNIKTEKGNTPLFYAACKGQKKNVETLLRYGADPSCTNSVGADAADVAIGGGYDEIAMNIRADSKYDRSFGQSIKKTLKGIFSK